MTIALINKISLATDISLRIVNSLGPPFKLKSVNL